jgi:hypothetical protein
MKKFVIHTRAIPGIETGDLTIVEVDGHILTVLEDPAIMFLPNGEFKFSISCPDFLCETKEIKLLDGTKKKIVVPSVYYSHSVYHSLDHVRAVAETMIQESLEFDVRKGRVVSFTIDDVKAKCSEIKELLLS